MNYSICPKCGRNCFVWDGRAKEYACHYTDCCYGLAFDEYVEWLEKELAEQKARACSYFSETMKANAECLAAQSDKAVVEQENERLRAIVEQTEQETKHGKCK